MDHRVDNRIPSLTIQSPTEPAWALHDSWTRLHLRSCLVITTVQTQELQANDERWRLNKSAWKMLAMGVHLHCKLPSEVFFFPLFTSSCGTLLHFAVPPTVWYSTYQGTSGIIDNILTQQRDTYSASNMLFKRSKTELKPLQLLKNPNRYENISQVYGEFKGISHWCKCYKNSCVPGDFKHFRPSPFSVHMLAKQEEFPWIPAEGYGSS